MSDNKTLAEAWKHLYETDRSDYHDQGLLYTTISPRVKLIKDTIAALEARVESSQRDAVLKELVVMIEADAKRFVSEGHDWKDCAETDHEGSFTEGYLKACKNIIQEFIDRLVSGMPRGEL